MQNLILYVVCLVSVGHAFFLSNQDLRRMFRLLPKTTELGLNYKSRENRHRQHEHEPLMNHEEYHDHYDRRDSEGNVKTKSHKAGLPHRHIYTDSNYQYPHEGCHHHHDHTEKLEKYERGHNEDKIQQYRNHHNDKVHRKQEELDNENMSGKKLNKDYITGVLVTIPRIKNANYNGNYLKLSKDNAFLQELLKENEEVDGHHHNHHLEPENIGSYIL